MAKGNVDFFNDTGGYGFISTEDADDDVFFHMEDVGGPDLEEGEEIEFDIEEADKAPARERRPQLSVSGCLRATTSETSFDQTTRKATAEDLI